MKRDKIVQSVLNKAFKDDLVQQVPNDELVEI